MATLTYPGASVVENLSPLLPSAFGVPAQATPVFAGVHPVGPTVPTLIGSWQQFINLYGSFSSATSSTDYLPYSVYQFFANGGTSCYVLRIENSDAVAASLMLLAVDAITQVLNVTASSPGAWGNNVYVSLTTSGTANRFNFIVYNGGSSASNIVEQFPDLSLNPLDSRYVVSVINSPTSGSAYVDVTPQSSYTWSAGNDVALISATALANGADGSTAQVLGNVVPSRLDVLQNQILNVTLPGVTDPTALNAIIAWADSRGDVMVFINGPAPVFPETTAQVAQNYVSMVTGGTPLSASSRAVLYAPWVLVQDPASQIPGATKWLPPVGAVLGVTQATDIAIGTQQPPAGVNAAIKVVDLEARFVPTDLTNLTAAQVNAIKVVPGYGFCIFGARTLHPGYPDRYINVRRTLQKIEHDCIALTQFAVFAPNDSALWEQITAALTNYLTQQMQSGTLAGSTPATSFSVVCDSTNNTSATAQAGMVNITVSVALLSPAEFITITITQLQAGTTTSTPTGT